MTPIRSYLPHRRLTHGRLPTTRGPLAVRATTLLAALTLGACTARVTAPTVQPSAAGEPGGRIVELNPDGSRTPPCLIIRVGQTVEFRNLAVEVPTNVSSLGEPNELYSPNLQTPYNRVDASDGAYSYWRHTFQAPGVFEYFDTNAGEPGQKVVDPYYGTVTFVGISDRVKTGVICVETPGGHECAGVCCGPGFDACPSSQCCDQTHKRCVLESPSYAQPLCVGKKPAFREFGCFAAPDCGESGVCTALHQCQE